MRRAANTGAVDGVDGRVVEVRQKLEPGVVRGLGFWQLGAVGQPEVDVVAVVLVKLRRGVFVGMFMVVGVADVGGAAAKLKAAEVRGIDGANVKNRQRRNERAHRQKA